MEIPIGLQNRILVIDNIRGSIIRRVEFMKNIKRIVGKIICSAVVAAGISISASSNVKAADNNAALLAAQQALLAQQYQAALQVQNAFITQHNAAMQQAFLLQQTQFLQYQQYQAMIQRSGLDYQSSLLSNYQKYQEAGLKSFLGYNGY